MSVLEHPFRSRRKHLGLKAKQVAVIAGVSTTYWSQFENGIAIPPVWQFAAVAAALQWSVPQVRAALKRAEKMKLKTPLPSPEPTVKENAQ